MADGSGGAIRRGRKFEQVLAGAREVFREAGFEGANVDDIARVAGVSKATLYSYFPDKRLLFTEVAKAECARQAAMAEGEIDTDRPIAEVLLEIARRIGAFVTSDFGIGMFRMCIAESHRFPGFGREFFETGPMVVRSLLIDLIEEACARGELTVPPGEAGLAVDQFHELCRAGLFTRALLGVETRFPPDELEATARGAVATFLARWGA